MTMMVREAPTTTRSRGVVYKHYSPFPKIGYMRLADYYEFQHAATEKHDLIEGEVFCMPGGSAEHNVIGANISHAINTALDSTDIDALVFSSDQKVYINEATVLYADVSLVVGKVQCDQNDALRNPFAIFEVLSRSTADFDLVRKFEYYRMITSLRHYVLVDQYRVAVTHFAKIAGDLWAIVGDYSQLDDALTMTIEGKEIAVPLAAIYRRMPLNPS